MALSAIQQSVSATILRTITASLLLALVFGLHTAPVQAISVTTSPQAASNSYLDNFSGFYTEPQQFPAEPGALIRTQRFTIHTLPSQQGLDVAAQRVWYTTTTSTGEIVPTTGVLLAGTDNMPNNTPLVVVGPGSRGQGPQCTASKSIGHLLAVGSSLDPRQAQVDEPFSLIANYETDSIRALLARGYRVFVIDYVGGATGPLSYLNNIEAGHAMLDAARVGRALNIVERRTPIALWGYSQGGAAAALGASLNATYAPDVVLSAAYVGAPPLNLTVINKHADGTMITGAGGYGVNAFMERYPRFRSEINRLFNAHGKEVLRRISNECFLDSVMNFGWEETKTWLKDGRPLWKHFATNPIMQELADEQLQAAYQTPRIPILLSTNPHDDIVAYEQVVPAYKRWCAAGTAVTLVRIEFGPFLPSSGMAHILPLYKGESRALQFLADIFTGKAHPKGCTVETI